jgi:hypothetical protein
VYSDVLKRHGWVWHSAPKFKVGKVLFGRKAKCSDMPSGIVIARQARHYVAVIDGIPNDIWDCSNKMVYGYWGKV